jgi:hypothetical protein
MNSLSQRQLPNDRVRFFPFLSTIMVVIAGINRDAKSNQMAPHGNKATITHVEQYTRTALFNEAGRH